MLVRGVRGLRGVGLGWGVRGKLRGLAERSIFVGRRLGGGVIGADEALETMGHAIGEIVDLRAENGRLRDALKPFVSDGPITQFDYVIFKESARAALSPALEGPEGRSVLGDRGCAPTRSGK